MKLISYKWINEGHSIELSYSQNAKLFKETIDINDIWMTEMGQMTTYTEFKQRLLINDVWRYFVEIKEGIASDS